MPLLNRISSAKLVTTTNSGLTSAASHSTPNLPSPSLPDPTPNADGQPPLPTTAADPADDNDGKLKQLLAVLKKAIGVKDMGAMRLSLPANLITPMGNLEYWCYLDRPDVFAAMDDSDDELERMLAVLRWTLTKDAKFIHGPVCKPYNSVLGEQFRCLFDVNPVKTDPSTGKLQIFDSPPPSPTPSPPTDRDRPTSLCTSTSSTTNEARSLTSTKATSLHSTSPSSSSETRVVFLNEQVSHHPPISCFWYEARARASNQASVIAYGVDQISAKFTGTSVKVFPGPANKGIFVKLPKRDEEYQITHPTATIAGLLRASPYVVISDYTYITCRGSKSRLRALINYTEESWIGKAKFGIEGVIYTVPSNEDNPDQYTKLKHVPSNLIKCTFTGSWRGLVTYQLSSSNSSSSTSSKPLIDLSILNPLPKSVKSEDQQEDYESRKFWSGLTSLIKEQNFSEATKLKLAIEQQQREIAGKRKTDFVPELFVGQTWREDGKSILSDGGIKALENEFSRSS